MQTPGSCYFSTSHVSPKWLTEPIECNENKTHLINLNCEVSRTSKIWVWWTRATIEELSCSAECNEIYFSKEDNSLLFNDSSIHNTLSLKSNQEEAEVISYCLDILNDSEKTIVKRSLSADTWYFFYLIGTHSMQGWTATTRKKKHQKIKAHRRKSV